MIQISKDSLKEAAEGSTLEDTTKTEKEVQKLTRELAELVVKFNVLENKVEGFDEIFNTDSLTALTGTINDLFSTNLEVDALNTDKHSFSAGLTGHFVTMQPGTIVYAHTNSSYILVIWLSEAAYITVTPYQYQWQINRDYTLSLPSGDAFVYSYLGNGATDNATSTLGPLRLLNSGCTLKGNLNAEYTGTTEFADGIIVDYLLQVEGQTFITGDVDIGGDITTEGSISTSGDVTAQGNIDVTGNIKTNGNCEVDGTLTVKGDIVQEGSSYETHAEKLYTKKDLIITRDGAVSALTSDEVTGIQAEKYDGTNDGQLVFGPDGIARVGDVGDTQPLMTREEAPTNGDLFVWNNANKQAVTKHYEGFYTGSITCSTAADTEIKSITIDDELVAGAVLGITFTNGNTFGDTTLETPTYPKLSVNGGSYYPICDSTGHYAGTGCFVENGYYELRFTGSIFIILNSDVRQQVSGESGYTIYANGFIRQWNKVSPPEYVQTGGYCTITLRIAMKDTNYTISMTNLNPKQTSNINWAFYEEGSTNTTFKVYLMNVYRIQYIVEGYID